MANESKYSSYSVGIGNVKISDDVIASIAAVAACEVEGVDSMAGDVTTELAGKIGIKNMSKGASIKVLADGIHCDLYIVLSFGNPIRSTCEAVQERVKDAIENMTGINVCEVNIHIVEIAVKSKKDK